MCRCADNVTGLKPDTEALDFSGSSTTGVVGERCRSSEPSRKVNVGATTSENAGMSSVLLARNKHTVSLRFPKQG
jgi:hypothetical protein